MGKEIFRCVASVVTFLLIAAAIIIRPWDAEEDIALFNLGVDIAVGFFTVWGLYWAASEFAASQVKPELHLKLANAEQIGRTIRIDLFLQNKSYKAARGVRLAIRIYSTPVPDSVEHRGAVFHVPIGKPERNKGSDNYYFAIQYSSELVFYEHPAYLGHLNLRWDLEKKQPGKILFRYTTYNLEGPLTKGEVPLPKSQVNQPIPA